MSDEVKSFKQGDVEFNLVDDDYKEKMAAFEVDCNDGKGEPMACHNVGEFFAVINSDHKRARGLYERNCRDNNFGPSCFNLAKLYLSGKKGGVPQDDAKALELFSKACENGHNPACYHEGTLLYTTAKEKVEAEAPSATSASKADLTRSVSLLTKACFGGIGDSCYRGASYWLRPGASDRDPVKALPLLQAGCEERGHALSCHNLAVMYNKGDKGIAADPKKFA
jgi:TPR repeat protein